MFKTHLTTEPALSRLSIQGLAILPYKVIYEYFAHEIHVSYLTKHLFQQDAVNDICSLSIISFSMFTSGVPFHDTTNQPIPTE